ncbi:MAG: methylmalonyl-CoA mutase family protein [Owenweeksia sp.]
MAQDLFEDFPRPTKEDWINRITKDLKGKEFNHLISESAEDIAIQPVYHIADGTPAYQPFRKEAGWSIVQEILVMNTSTANKEALDHLSRGADALLFYLPQGIDLKVLLQDILIQHIRVHFVTEGKGLEIAIQLNKIIRERALDPASVQGSINIDALENIARTGNWFQSRQADMAELKKLTDTCPENIKSLCLNANLFCNAGATLDQQLGIILSMAYEYIHELELTHAGKFWINKGIGSDYFGEIASLRALRRVWSQLLEELQIPDSPLHIYAETGLRNKTILDAYNNMIRSSAEAMAAGIGGCDEFSAKGFDQTFREPTAFGERVAKNQQSIFQHESYLDKVRDISKGSYFIEELTEELATRGWAFFKAIEAEGGYIKALENGWLQMQLEEKAKQEEAAFKAQSKTLIGANKYLKQDENLKDLIEQGHFYKIPLGKTTLNPVKVKRLSEELEKDQ